MWMFSQFYFVEDVTHVAPFSTMRLMGCPIRGNNSSAVNLDPDNAAPRVVVHDEPIGNGIFIYSRDGFGVDTVMDASLMSKMRTWDVKRVVACFNGRVWSLSMYFGPSEVVCNVVPVGYFQFPVIPKGSSACVLSWLCALTAMPEV